ncbi:MAG: preprotein translocase subunit YajC [Endomicrobium sp.]|jgi:preprotein translocase subunit YajC|nr:preprotein translocase subunit YajC [Endomicrobium sp.]
MKKIIFILTWLYFFNPSLVFAKSLNESSVVMKIVPLIFVFIFFYLFLLRPQYKKNKDHQKLLNSLKKGDTIITIGGLYAQVIELNGNIVKAQITDTVCVKIAKQAISVVIHAKDNFTKHKNEL